MRPDVEQLLGRIENDVASLRRLLSEDPEAQVTGCRATQGTHGIGYVRDPLGTDAPPRDWPFPLPTKEEIRAARRAREKAEKQPAESQ